MREPSRDGSMNSVSIPNHLGSMTWGGTFLGPFLGRTRPNLDQYDLTSDLPLVDEDDIDLPWVEGDDETGRP